MNLKVGHEFINTNNVLTVCPKFDPDTGKIVGAVVTFPADFGAEGYVGPYSEEYEGSAGMALLDWYENNSVDVEIFARDVYLRSMKAQSGPSITEARSYGVDVDVP